MAKPITNRVKTGKTPVIRKDLEGGVVAEANNDGSIYVDKSVKKGSPLEKEAIAHEKVHLDQMKRGDLNYDDDNVYWKGKSYPRSTMNEGAKKLPWEKEAYDKTEHMNTKSKKKSPATETKNSPMNMKATPITYKSSALKRTIAAKEFMKTYGGEDIDPPKETKKSERVIKDGKVYKLETTNKPGSSKTTAKKDVKYSGALDPNIYKVLGDEIVSGFAKRKYGYTGTNPKEYEKIKLGYNSGSETVTTPPTVTETYTPEEIKRPGTPGKEGTYQMGFWESSNLAAARRGMYRNQQKQNRRRQRDAARFDRQYSKGKTMYDTKTGNPIPNTPEGKAGYIRSQAAASNPDFSKQVGLVTGGTTSTLSTVEQKTAKDVKGEKLRNVDLKTGLLPNGRAVFEQTLKKPTKVTKSKNNADDLKAVRSRSGAQYNATNKSKSAFKMGGYGSKKK